MITKLELREGEKYQRLRVDGSLVASIWGVAKVTGKVVNSKQQVTIGGTGAFLWVDEVEWFEGRGSTMKLEEAIEGKT